MEVVNVVHGSVDLFFKGFTLQTALEYISWLMVSGRVYCQAHGIRGFFSPKRELLSHRSVGYQYPLAFAVAGDCKSTSACNTTVRRSVFKKDCYCIPPNLALLVRFKGYAISVLFKNASTS